MWNVECGMWDVGGSLEWIDLGLDDVLLDEILDIADAVVDFSTDLRKGDDFMVTPGLSSPAGNFHQLDELIVVDERFQRTLRKFFDPVMDEVDLDEKILKLIFGDNNCFHDFRFKIEEAKEYKKFAIKK